MTAVADTKTVVEILAGETLTNAKIANVVNNFLYSYLNDPRGLSIDMETATNEEKAQEFLDALKTFAKSRLSAGGRAKALADNEDAVNIAAEAAASDI